MNRATVKISDIIIPRAFAASIPNTEKVSRCRRFYNENGRLDREIVVNNHNVLRDGYIGLLVLIENGVTEVDVIIMQSKSYRDNPTLYVFGRHNTTNPKEYCWRITNKTRGVEYAKLGNRMVVDTAQGAQLATITRVEKLDTPPVNRKVRGVIKCLDE